MKTETTKQRILTEAVRLFARSGYEAVSVEQIANAVGIKAPSLYKHYKSKRDIFEHILREMERRDQESAVADSLPEEGAEIMPEAYERASVNDLIRFSRRQFHDWTEDGFAASFRKMLTVEQYRSTEMNELYHQYLGSGPLQYTADLLGSREKALAFYGPMYLLYSVYDAADDKSAVFRLLERHLEQWQGRKRE